MKTLKREPAARSCRQRPSRWLKVLILEAQDHRCLGCEAPLKDREFDHVIPLGIGGSNAADNWAALCPRCHRSKTRQDLKRIAKAKRQRRYHETGRSRAPTGARIVPGVGPTRGFDRTRKKALNGVVTKRCDCAQCRPRGRAPRNSE